MTSHPSTALIRRITNEIPAEPSSRRNSPASPAHQAPKAVPPAKSFLCDPKKEFRAFIESLNAGFSSDEIQEIISAFKFRDQLLKKWNAVKGKQAQVLMPLSRDNGKLAHKLIEVLKKAGC